MTNFLATFSKNFKTLIGSPITILALVSCMILLLAFIKFKSIKFDAKLMARIGLAIALALLLDMIKLYTLPNGGGSISLGSMLPILLLAYVYGPVVGVFTGFLFGLLKLIINPYILSPIQVFFDYPLPFMAVGMAGYFKSNKFIGAILGMSLRFVFHFISGVIFFGQYAPDGIDPAIYSLSVNGFAVGGELILCLILLYFLPINQLTKILKPDKEVISS